MTIGIPRAMLYYKSRYLWDYFFKQMGCDTLISGNTNKKILADGVKYSIDECCLPAKVYMGHVYSLIGKCDYILVPRVEGFSSEEKVCVKFNAMYDIVKNTFRDVKLIDYNIDAKQGAKERTGFIQMGRVLGKSRRQSLAAYNQAKIFQSEKSRHAAVHQEKLLNNSDKLKILIVSHPYNTYDNMIGQPIVKAIRLLDGEPIYADAFDRITCIEKSKAISQQLYWTYNKELLGAIELCRDRIDGIILITAFPCGPDSLVNDLVIRRVKDVPVSNIIVDELQGEAGLQTRIESFMDIIKEKRISKHGKSNKLSSYGQL